MPRTMDRDAPTEPPPLGMDVYLGVNRRVDYRPQSM